ncbi:M15 family metallopeptidase [Dyadobacter sp. LHD-138]|uniref:M15 family metallopeptidase n=1 Tax=Dyadobacter sp. LHD-138 TaxID=3071413 RepID=UPI0027E05A05|nr:M15 family metallopeptidase [Dyadobacter sp. LHD-138]MDQ6482241.1 M15 family metallopeptidase [Dyadobacter sp. LHD-138]
MKTQTQLIAKFGNPYTARAKFEKKWMELWDIPQEINDAIPALPNKIYVNYLLIAVLESTFRELIARGLHKEIRTFDGCFNIRPKRGSSGISTHAWGISIDLNATWNPFRGKVTWSKEFLDAWRKNGWICGADWSATSKDGMHFQWEGF